MDLDLSVFHDGYKERIEALIKSKMKGEVAQVEEKSPKKPVAKSMMETAESLKRLPCMDRRLGGMIQSRL
jgi:non-homologous end joining protein Ku